MWELSVDWWEPILRGIVIYTVLFILMRLLGKKQIGQPSPFDFVLLLIVGEGVSNALTGDDHSITNAVMMAATLIGVDFLMDHIAYKYPKAEIMLEGAEQILIRDGQILEPVRQKNKVTYKEIESSVRGHGISSIDDVKLGVLENSGKISILPKHRDQHQLMASADDAGHTEMSKT